MKTTADRYSQAANEIIEELVNGEGVTSHPNSFESKILNDEVYASQVETYEKNPDKFHNSKTPPVAILEERPEHRKIIMLCAMGMSYKEIAEVSGRTPASVSLILRQPWAKQRLCEEITKAGRDPLRTIIEAAAMDSVNTLIELRDDPKVPASVRKGASDSLLDRFLGKPTQHVESTTTVKNVPADIVELEQELKKIEAEEKRLLGTSSRN